MKLHHYDIVRQEDDKSATWLEAVSALNTAECLIQELVSLWPGEFQVADQQSHRSLLGRTASQITASPWSSLSGYDN
jgi:hypothetical protein